MELTSTSSGDVSGDVSVKSSKDESAKSEVSLSSPPQSPSHSPSVVTPFWDGNSGGVGLYQNLLESPRRPSKAQKFSTALEEQLAADSTLALETTPVTRNTRNKEESFFPQNRESIDPTDQPEEEDDGEETILFESILTEPVTTLEGSLPQPGSPKTKLFQQQKRRFDLDLCLEKSSQAQVYQHAVGDVVRRNILRGYNTSVMAYGCTDAGKTYTLFGDGSSSDSNNVTSSDGVFPRAMAELLEAKRHHISAAASKSRKDEGRDFQLEMTAYEIDHDDLKDLLVQDSNAAASHSQNKKLPKLQIRDHNSAVHGLQVVPVVSLAQARRVLKQALERRKRNSHAMVAVHVRLGNGKQARLTLCDLAGADRRPVPQQGNHQVSYTIQKDFKSLDKVGNALSEFEQTMPKLYARRFSNNNIVPYRESKLTRLLRDSLGGNCCTVMIACVAPNSSVQDAVLPTLTFAERCKAIQCHVSPNYVAPTRGSANTDNNAPSTSAQGAEESPIKEIQTENKRLNNLLSKYKRRLKKIQHQAAFPSDDTSKAGTADKSAVKVSDSKSYCSSLDDASLSSVSTASTSWRQQQALSGSLRSKLAQAQLEAQAARSNSQKIMEQMQGLRNRKKKDSPIRKMMGSKTEARATSEQDDGIDKKVGAVVTIPHNDQEALGLEQASSFGSAARTASITQESMSNVDNDAIEEKNALSDQLSELRRDVSAKQAELESLTREHASTRQELRDEIMRLESLREELKTEVDGLLQQRKSFEADGTILSSLRGCDEQSPSECKDVLGLDQPETKESDQLDESSSVVLLKHELDQIRAKMSSSQDKHKIELEEVKAQNIAMIEEMQLLRQQVHQVSPSRAVSKGSDDVSTHNSVLQAQVKDLTEQVLDLKSTNTRQQELLQRQFDSAANLPNEDEHSLPPPPPNTKKQSRPWPRKKKKSSSSSKPKRHMWWRGEDQKSEIEEKKEEIFDAEVREALPSSADSISDGFEMLREVESEHQEMVSSHLKTPNNRRMFGRRSSPNLPVISNLDSIGEIQSSSTGPCKACEGGNVFPGKPDDVEFYLPKLSISCSCGKNHNKIPKDVEDPTALKHILRDWQVEFLASLDITDTSQFVRIADTRANRLARMLRQWRRDRKMRSVRTKSCAIAIHIWARTCNAVRQAVQEQNGQSPTRSVLEYQVRQRLSNSGQLASVTEDEPLSSLDDGISDVSSWLTGEF